MSPEIATYGLTKRYLSGAGLFDLEIEVHPGEVLGAVGPRGSGKSTLLKLLATRIRPTEGSFRFRDRLIRAGRRDTAAITAIRSQSGVLLEDLPVLGDLTGWENAWLLARLHGVPSREAERRLRLLFDWAEISPAARLPARSYSFPMRKKLGIICALVHSPRLLLLDDPCQGLEGSSRVALQELLAQVRSQGTTVLLATSDFQESRLLCTRLLLLDRGRLVAQGAVGELTASPWTWSAIEMRLNREGLSLDLSDVPGIRFAPEYQGCGLRVRVENPEAALPHLMTAVARGGGQVSWLEVQRP